MPTIALPTTRFYGLLTLRDILTSVCPGVYLLVSCLLVPGMYAIERSTVIPPPCFSAVKPHDELQVVKSKERDIIIPPLPLKIAPIIRQLLCACLL